jgi:hypothetical protein
LFVIPEGNLRLLLPFFHQIMQVANAIFAPVVAGNE